MCNDGNCGHACKGHANGKRAHCGRDSREPAGSHPFPNNRSGKARQG
jgi:hypothetical protein